MPSFTQRAIKESFIKLLNQRPLKQITVKDIVEDCGINRNTFYYHFEDIPDLFRWMLRQDTERTLLEVKNLNGGEERLRYLFAMAINSLPYMKKGMKSSYRDELELFLTQYIQRLFEQVCDNEGLYQNCSRAEEKLILRYHSQAIMGILRNWTEEDTKNLDQIVHTVFRLMTDGISPVE